MAPFDPRSRPSNPKEIQRQARALRNKPGWDPSRFVTEDPLHQLRELDQQGRNTRTYAQTEACPACEDARAQSRDPDALCEKHLADALGF